MTGRARTAGVTRAILWMVTSLCALAAGSCGGSAVPPDATCSEDEVSCASGRSFRSCMACDAQTDTCELFLVEQDGDIAARCTMSGADDACAGPLLSDTCEDVYEE